MEDYAVLNISGDPQITGNRKIAVGETSGTVNNVQTVEVDQMHLTGDFTGAVGIAYPAAATPGAQFGVTGIDGSGVENFTYDLGDYVAAKNGSALVWRVFVPYPSYIPDVDEAREKFDVWTLNYLGGDRDSEGAYEDAFLLNCAPADVAVARAAFRITGFTKDDGNWNVTVNDGTKEVGEGGRYGNGYIHIVSVKTALFPTAPVDSDFFRATLTVLPVEK